MRSHIDKAVFNLNDFGVFLFAYFAGEPLHIISSDFEISLSDLNLLINPIFQTFDMDGRAASGALAWRDNVVFFGLALVDETDFAFHGVFFGVETEFVF